ncbi:MAG: fused MFS/spermidine synthase [Gemmatimonadota bacterium]|nr:fused MFS/spermidine synthase [Gemmatimonadota bacterium]
MPVILYVVFILSGIAGLIYESIWTRYLGLFVGHTAYAQIIVLTIFLGGMSIGAIVIGQRSERLKQPLVVYACVEVVVGLIGLVFHDVFVFVTHFAYDTIFPPLAGGMGLLIAKWLIAALLILPQSILLGMTFPLMSAGALRLTSGRPGRVLALLYFANSIGAAMGVLLAGFYLIAKAGLPGTLLTAAIINIAVGLVTFLGLRLLRREGEAGASQRTQPEASSSLHLPARTAQLLLVISFGTAVASFIYEIAWIRMLSLVLGSATHSFELMLSAFILGLALGALCMHRLADRFSNSVRALGIIQWCMGCAALATLPVYLQSFEWTSSLLNALDYTDQGYSLFTVARYAFCLAVMVPSTFFAGMTLPLITRTLMVSGRGERAIGWVYGLNTLGSIVGVIAAGLVLLPIMGLKNLLIEGAVIDMALGVIVLRVAARGSARARNIAYGSALALAAVTLLAVRTGPFDQYRLASGVYRYARISGPNERRILFYKDGRTASVSVAYGFAGQITSIMTNGKPDASLDSSWFKHDGQRRPVAGDESTQMLLPFITLAHAPHAQSMAVIGFGSGMTSHILLGSPEARAVYTIEIEPNMPRGSRAFYPANKRAYDDPRSHIIIDDAKSFFAGTNQKFDLILSEPSNPWVSGVSGLFTNEFYQRIRSYLTPNGVFGQWLHLYEIDDGLVLTVLSAIHHNFRSYDVYLTGSHDILIVASNAAKLPAPDWSVTQAPAFLTDFSHLLPISDLSSAHLLDRAALAPLLDHWNRGNSDFYPVLDLGTERARFMRQYAIGFQELSGGRFDIIAPFENRRTGFGTTPVVPVAELPRMRALALGAALRGAIGPDSLGQSLGTALTSAQQRRWSLDASMASPTPPPDWKKWTQEFLAVDGDLHNGTAGVVNQPFYDAVGHFLDRQKAPEPLKVAVGFLHSLSTWDFATASRQADVLLPLAVKGEDWLPVDALRSGAVVAKLKNGDADGAGKYLVALAPRSRLSPSDLRAQLLAAYVQEARHRLTAPKEE